MVAQPFQTQFQSLALVANTTTNYPVNNLGAGTAGRIRWLVVTFSGELAAGTPALSNVNFGLRDNSVTTTYLTVAVLKQAVLSNALIIPCLTLISLNNLDILFGNGLTAQVLSATAGDAGVFDFNIGFDQTL